MRTVNLLPPEAFRRLSARRVRGRLIVLGILYVLFLLLLVALWQGRVNRAEAAVEEQQMTNDRLQQSVSQLVEAQSLVDDYNSNADLIGQALTVDMSWGRLLNDLARMIPDRVWLESFQGAVIDDSEGPLGSVTVSGIGFTFPDVSAWLRSLDSDRFEGVTGTWVQNLAETEIGVAPLVNFSSTTSLTEAALSSRTAQRIPEVDQ